MIGVHLYVVLRQVKLICILEIRTVVAHEGWRLIGRRHADTLRDDRNAMHNDWVVSYTDKYIGQYSCTCICNV